jgi:hypothetical protein
VARSREGLEPDITMARDAVWVAGASGNELFRVDPVRRRVTRRVRDAGRGVVVAAGAVWAADGDRRVVRVGGRGVARIRVGRLPVDVAATAASVWAITLIDRTLVQVDPRRRRVVRRIGLRGAAPAAVAAGAGLVAVAVR